MTALFLALLLSAPRWSVTVTDGHGKIEARYLAVTHPEERGSRLVFRVEDPPVPEQSGDRTREVSVPSDRATVEEVRERARPYEDRSR